MTPYELMVKANHHLIKVGELIEEQKAKIVGQMFELIKQKAFDSRLSTEDGGT